jgi:hypothetical protein
MAAGRLLAATLSISWRRKLRKLMSVKFAPKPAPTAASEKQIGTAKVSHQEALGDTPLDQPPPGQPAAHPIHDQSAPPTASLAQQGRRQLVEVSLLVESGGDHGITPWGFSWVRGATSPARVAGIGSASQPSTSNARKHTGTSILMPAPPCS